MTKRRKKILTILGVIAYFGLWIFIGYLGCQHNWFGFWVIAVFLCTLFFGISSLVFFKLFGKRIFGLNELSESQKNVQVRPDIWGEEYPIPKKKKEKETITDPFEQKTLGVEK